MRREEFSCLRRRALGAARGRVLEIGFGTGLNLPHYDPAKVERLIVVDDNAGMSRRAAERIDASPIAVESIARSAEALPLDDASVDTVVSSWTLCSIPDVAAALGEIRRALAPGGRFLFVEHGLAPEPKVQAWQHRLTPVQRVIGVGCHLDRKIDALIADAGFGFERLDAFYMERAPRFAGFTYLGAATVEE